MCKENRNTTTLAAARVNDEKFVLATDEAEARALYALIEKKRCNALTFHGGRRGARAAHIMRNR